MGDDTQLESFITFDYLNNMIEIESSNSSHAGNYTIKILAFLQNGQDAES